MFEAYRWPMLTDLWVPIVAAVVIGAVQHVFINSMKGVMWDVCKEKVHDNLRLQKSMKSTEALFKGIYFTFTVTVGTIIFQQTTFLPRCLFPMNPDARHENMYENYPLMPYGEQFRIYFIGSLGYHLLKTFEQVTAPVKRSDHIEMMLHHGLTVILILGSYMLNLLECGCLIIYIHDIADIFGHLGKCFGDTHFGFIKNIVAVCLWFSWLYTRLICLPLIAYVSIVLPDEKPFAPVYSGGQDQYLN